MFSRVFPGKPYESAARGLYGTIVSRARAPEFYRDAGVPDTVDGRFEALLLHMFLVLQRLKRDHAQTSELGQTLFDILIFDMDQSIRVSGVGDLKVGPRIKAMGQAFYGRMAAYEAGLEEGPEALSEALCRNLYGTVTPPEPEVLDRVVGYIQAEAKALSEQETAALLRGEVRFGSTRELRKMEPAPRKTD